MSNRNTVDICRDCHNPIPEMEARRIGRIGLCEPCRQKHIAAWRNEHTRQGSTDTRKHWLIGDIGSIKIGKETYDAKIIDMSDVSRSEHDHDLLMLELTKTYKLKGWDNKEIVQTKTWVHPEPIPSYRLRKAVLHDEVSA